MTLQGKKIGVLMGGRSAEREESLRSGLRVLRCLLEMGHDATGVELEDPREVLGCQLDVAFVALHGGEGEGGILQALLELCKLPYTGPGVLSAALCANRVLCRRVCAHAGVPTPRFVALSELDGAHMDLDLVKGRLAFPVLLRPVSDAGTTQARQIVDEAGFLDIVQDLKSSWGPLLAEELIGGKELSCFLLGDEMLVPGPLEPRLETALRRSARRALDAVGCRGLGQVEVCLDEAGIPWVSGLRPLPHLGEGAKLPTLAAAAGYRFDETVVRILETAMLKSPRNPWVPVTSAATEWSLRTR